MTDETFATFIARDRERLNKDREEIFNQQHELELKLDAVNREFAAIDAYEAAKSGKPLVPVKQVRASRAPSRGRRGGKRDALMHTIRQNPDGLTRGEILEKMGLKGDKSGEMSISNALTALTKANQVSRRDGKYTSA
jgi:hypothetical protein